MEILFDCFSLIPINTLFSPTPSFPFPRKFWSISSKIRYVYPLLRIGETKFPKDDLIVTTEGFLSSVLQGEALSAENNKSFTEKIP